MLERLLETTHIDAVDAGRTQLFGAVLQVMLKGNQGRK